MLAEEYPVIEKAASYLKVLTEDEKYQLQQEAWEDNQRRINGLIQLKERAEKEKAAAKQETVEAKRETAEIKETADQGVINMLADSMPIDQICRYSGYSPERVSELAKANKISLMQ